MTASARFVSQSAGPVREMWRRHVGSSEFTSIKRSNAVFLGTVALHEALPSPLSRPDDPAVLTLRISSAGPPMSRPCWSRSWTWMCETSKSAVHVIRTEFAVFAPGSELLGLPTRAAARARAPAPRERTVGPLARVPARRRRIRHFGAPATRRHHDCQNRRPHSSTVHACSLVRFLRSDGQGTLIAHRKPSTSPWYSGDVAFRNEFLSLSGQEFQPPPRHTRCDPVDGPRGSRLGALS